MGILSQVGEVVSRLPHKQNFTSSILVPATRLSLKFDCRLSLDRDLAGSFLEIHFDPI